jgi:hypothetical protein
MCRIRLLVIFFETNIQIAEMAFCKADFIIIKPNYFQNVQKIDVRVLVLQNHPKSIRTSARMSILRTSASKWPGTA